MGDLRCCNLSKVSKTTKGWTLPQLIEEFKGDLVGRKVYEQYGNEFPLLVKILDAAQDLSIQVHPNDKLAKERHNSLGKKPKCGMSFRQTKEQKLISGFKKTQTKKNISSSLNSGKLMDILNEEEVEAETAFTFLQEVYHHRCRITLGRNSTVIRCNLSYL